MTMHSDGYFDIKRDIQIVNDGGFFCQGCLAGKPASEQSDDLRYCNGCYETLGENVDGTPGIVKASPISEEAVTKPQGVSKDRGNAVTADVTAKIRLWAGQGKSCRDIEKELAATGVIISYRTIHRRLQGVTI